jgi:hypothetical protein
MLAISGKCPVSFVKLYHCSTSITPLRESNASIIANIFLPLSAEYTSYLVFIRNHYQQQPIEPQ